MEMYNNYYLIKKVEEVEGKVALASVQDSFTYKGEVVDGPTAFNEIGPKLGDHVLFLKGSGEDVQVEGKTYKVVKLEDIIMKLGK